MGSPHHRRRGADRRSGDEPAAGMASAGLHRGWVCWGDRNGALTCTALASRRLLAGIAITAWATGASLDRWRFDRGGFGSRDWPLGHQSAGRGRRASFRFANTVFRMGRDRDVGGIRRCAAGLFSRTFPPETAHMAPRPYCSRNNYGHRKRGPCHADRRNNGDGVENRAMCFGPRGDT